jgi:uncharacterized membrane protein YoaK (UPF0700 family)
VATVGAAPQPGPRPSAGPAAGGAGRQDGLLHVLMALTLLSGVVDAVCYLGLGRVFTANMTGNVVVIGFAAAGAPGFSIPASLTSLLVFLMGAVAGGRLSQHLGKRSRALAVAIWCEAGFVAAAAVVAFVASTVAEGWGRYTTIAILAFAMGIRNAVIRKLAVPDMTTTVLTQTLTGLAADSFLAGGANTRAGRRVAAVVAMAAGAAGGAALYLHHGAALPLAISAAAAAATVIALWASRVGRVLDQI